jgi:hypothetical protein
MTICLEGFLGSLITSSPFGRSLLVLLGFSKFYGFACKTYTYAFKRPIPSGRGIVTPPSLHRLSR